MTELGFKITTTPPFVNIIAAFGSLNFQETMQRMVSRLGFMVEAESKKVTPVKTGRLRASIMTDIGNLRAKIAPHTDYAGFVHWGTKYMKARPFMIWGFEGAMSRSDEPLQAATNEMAEKIKKAFGGKI